MKPRTKKRVKKPSAGPHPEPALHTDQPLAEKDEVKDAEERTRRRSAEKDVEAELKIRGLK